MIWFATIIWRGLKSSTKYKIRYIQQVYLDWCNQTKSEQVYLVACQTSVHLAVVIFCIKLRCVVYLLHFVCVFPSSANAPAQTQLIIHYFISFSIFLGSLAAQPASEECVFTDDCRKVERCQLIADASCVCSKGQCKIQVN